MKPFRVVGAKPKYPHVIQILDPGTLYSPAMISDAAIAARLIPNTTRARRRLSKTLAAFASRNLCDLGDGLVVLRGQAPMPGWYGRSWSEHYLRD